MKRRVLSLFSGCGGMDLGFEGNFEINPCFVNTEIYPDWLVKKNKKYYLKETSFEIIFANDILKEAKAAYIPFFQGKGNSTVNFYSESIVDLVKMHKNKLFNFPENIDVVIGGFPCQDFSVAGKRKGFKSHKNHNGNGICELDIASEENRGQLYMWMKEVIEITKPKVFYAENVKGLASLGDVKKIIENDFKSIDNEGYLVLPARVLNAANYGVPQNRERIIFIGLNKKYLKKNIAEEINLYPKETHYNSKKNQLFKDDNLLMPYTTCRQALRGLKEPEFEKNDLSQISYSKAKFCKGYQGNIEIKIDHTSPTIRAEHHGNIEYRRLSEENGGKYMDELKTEKERRLTVRECARLQTFPDNYNFVRRRLKNELFPISASGAYRVIGNAVPPLLAYHLSKQLEYIWDEIF